MAEGDANKVRFELVSPAKLLVDEPVDMVVVPGAEGDFGVLPGHSLVISTVRPGVIDVYRGGEVTERVFVAGGFAEVTHERCTVLAEEAMPVGELDPDAINSQIKDTREDIADAKDDAARAAAEARLAVLEAKLDAARAA